MIREATPEDGARISEIYAPFVTGSSVSFEEVPPTAADMAARLSAGAEFCPWRVFSDAGRVVGYCYASRHRVRASYRHCCEVSVYVDAEARGKGVATALYRSLFGELRARGFFNAYAGVADPEENRPSVALHESLGFEKIGVYEKIGYKFGAWHDVAWWGLRLREGEP